MNKPPRIDIIIPAYNEEQSISKVIRDIPIELVREIIVCNNNSSDKTADYAMRAGAKVVLQLQKGYGAACMTGINYISSKPLEDHPDIVVFMDADYSDFPQELPALIEPIARGHDLVIGSRILGLAQHGSLTPQQRFGNWLATTLIRVLYGFQFTDLGPFRAIRWNKLIELNMQDRDFGWTAEMQIKALKQKFKCIEIPVSYRKRIGESKISGTMKGTILAGYKILRTVFKWC
jgi:glycosyltransferase involved in cell wall biosynthesis